VVLVIQEAHLVTIQVTEVQVAQAEEQVELQVFVHHIQLQQEQVLQVKVIQAVLLTSHTLNMLVEQVVAVLVQQVAMVMLLGLPQQFLNQLLHLKQAVEQVVLVHPQQLQVQM
jgi:hypothetical protein